MICGGDELSRTQRGNNNAYCQDNEISWFDWDLDERREAFLDFTRRLMDVRRRHPGLRRQHFFQGKPIRGSEIKDVTWLRVDGDEIDRRRVVHVLGALLRHAPRRQHQRDRCGRAFDHRRRAPRAY